MKRLMSWAIVAATMVWGGLQATSATPPRPSPLPVSAPFAMDKAATSARIDFWVTPEQVKAKRRLMLALDFPQTEHGNVEDAIQQQDIPIQAEVFWVNEGKTTPIPTQDNRAILQNPAQGQQMSIAHLHLYGTNGHTSNVLITGFYPSGPGHYFATVKTVEDRPVFSGIQTSLRVAPFYNTGE